MRRKLTTYLLPIVLATPLLCTGCHPRMHDVTQTPELYSKLPQQLGYIHNQGIAVLKLDHTIRFMIPSDIFFQGPTTTLRPNKKAALEQVAAVAANYPDATIHITGYSDNILHADAAKAQSLAEAQAIAGFLWNDGLTTQHMIVTGQGYKQPINSMGSPKAGAQNRRVEMFISPTN